MKGDSLKANLVGSRDWDSFPGDRKASDGLPRIILFVHSRTQTSPTCRRTDVRPCGVTLVVGHV